MRTLGALVLCLAALPVLGKGDVSHYVDELSCSSGPYGLKLPKSYEALRKLGPLVSERLVREADLGRYKAHYRDLVFSGLRLGVVTFSDDPDRYEVTSAEIRSPRWRIAGPFRPGQALPPVVGDVATKALPGSATVEFSGEEDTVRVRLVGRRISVLTYLCVAD